MDRASDLNEILVFVRVAELRSFTKAGERLGLPKSTVSRKIAQLEARLGVGLIQRTTRTINLTETGLAYLERCTRIIEDMQEADALVSSMQSAPTGLLRVTAPPELGNLLLSEAVREYLVKYPQVSVELDLSQRVVDLVAENFDVAFRAAPLSDSTLIARKLGSPTVGIVAAPAYLKKRKPPQTPADLAKHQCLIFSAIPERHDWRLSRGDEDVTVRVNGRFAANSLLILRDLALDGFGLARIPDLAVQDDLSAGRLVRVLPEWRLAGATVYAVYPGRRFLAPKVQAFLELLTSRMGR
jgi:DNA-binding transcriptional LysR family regulator